MTLHMLASLSAWLSVAKDSVTLILVMNDSSSSSSSNFYRVLGVAYLIRGVVIK